MDEFLGEMGKRISMRRKQLGLTQEKLAEKAGLTSQTISTAETGTKALRPWNIVKLCKPLIRIWVSYQRKFLSCHQSNTGIWKI